MQQMLRMGHFLWALGLLSKEGKLTQTRGPERSQEHRHLNQWMGLGPSEDQVKGLSRMTVDAGGW